MKFLQIEKLCFQQAEEILGTGIVKTIAFSGHTLPDAFLFQHFLIVLVLILPALVWMKNQICVVRYFCKCFLKHIRYLIQIRMTA